jgi:hypothetical protein
MRKFVLAAVLILVAGGAQAASYLQNGGAIVDPIQSTLGGNHSYSGANLQPGAFLANADLTFAILNSADLVNATLTSANLSNANLTDAILFDADLFNADLSNADLSFADLGSGNLSDAILFGANLSGANLFGADFSNTILANAIGLDSTFSDFATLYNANTDFTGTFFDPVAAGWTLVPIPEPNTALLLSLGLTGLAAKRRRSLRS